MMLRKPKRLVDVSLLTTRIQKILNDVSQETSVTNSVFCSEETMWEPETQKDEQLGNAGIRPAAVEIEAETSEGNGGIAPGRRWRIREEVAGNGECIGHRVGQNLRRSNACRCHLAGPLHLFPSTGIAREVPHFQGCLEYLETIRESRDVSEALRKVSGWNGKWPTFTHHQLVFPEVCNIREMLLHPRNVDRLLQDIRSTRSIRWEHFPESTTKNVCSCWEAIDLLGANFNWNGILVEPTDMANGRWGKRISTRNIEYFQLKNFKEK